MIRNSQAWATRHQLERSRGSKTIDRGFRERGERKMTEQPINDKNLTEQLRAAFPELEVSYQARVDAYRGEGLPSAYEVVGFVFKPRLKEEVAKGEITEFLRRSALFIERVFSSGDSEAINVVWITILEWLIFEPKPLHLLWPVLGSKSKAGIEDAARRWSDAGRNFGHAQGLPVDNLPKR